MITIKPTAQGHHLEVNIGGMNPQMHSETHATIWEAIAKAEKVARRLFGNIPEPAPVTSAEPPAVEHAPEPAVQPVHAALVRHAVKRAAKRAVKPSAPAKPVARRRGRPSKYH